jgi:hypothetical protein
MCDSMWALHILGHVYTGHVAQVQAILHIKWVSIYVYTPFAYTASWQTTSFERSLLLKDYPCERPSLWKTTSFVSPPSIVKDHLFWKTTLVKDHLFWRTTLVKDHPFWKTTLEKEHLFCKSTFHRSLRVVSQKGLFCTPCFFHVVHPYNSTIIVWSVNSMYCAVCTDETTLGTHVQDAMLDKIA